MKWKAPVRILTGILAAAQLFALSGCGTSKSKQLSTGNALTSSDLADRDTIQTGVAPIDDFTVRLLQQMETDENLLLSPLSVLYATTMLMNGAEGETLSQMEDVLGDRTLLNSTLPSISYSFATQKEKQLQTANSVWIRDTNTLTIKRDFLNQINSFYNASIYQAPFDDTTLHDINQWVSDQTDGMIEKMLESISEDAMMYLINAICFDANWKQEYKESDIQDGFFTMEDGTKRDVSLMYAEESTYLRCDNAEGFRKPYAGGKYAFAALLPEEGLSMDDFIASLDGETLADILGHPVSGIIHAAIPQFTTSYEVELSDAFQQMGVVDAFDPYLADFSGIGATDKGRLAIDLILHKTHLELDETGTKAAAATIIEGSGAAFDTSESLEKTILLDRPFLYMIIDTSQNIPVFIGTLMDPEK